MRKIHIFKDYTPLSLWAGPAVFLFLLYLFSDAAGFKETASLAAAAWMGIWWIARPVHIAVTALLPIAVNAALSLVPMQLVVSQYFSEIIVLILAADFLCMTWTVTGLDKRLSLRILCSLSGSFRRQIALWLTVSAVLSVFLPNVVVCTLMTPVAVAMLRYAGEPPVSRSRLAVPLLLAVAWGAGIGGVGSPLGGAANLVAISYIEGITGHEFMYISWFSRFLPFLGALLLVNLCILFLIPVPHKTLSAAKDYFRAQYKALGPMAKGERLSLGLFLAATVLAFLRPLYAPLLPGMKPAYVFLIFALVCFIVRTGKGQPLLTWSLAEKETMWGLLILFGGGLALGRLVTETGGAAALSRLITMLPLSGGAMTILAFTLFCVVLTEISSNTAAAAIAMPIIQNLTETMGLSPIPYLLLATAAVNTAYILPVSIRAIPVSYGLDASAMARWGAHASVLSILAITALGSLFLYTWPGFSAL